jgi:hypothetical protein
MGSSVFKFSKSKKCLKTKNKSFYFPVTGLAGLSRGSKANLQRVLYLFIKASFTSTVSIRVYEKGLINYLKIT